MTASELHARLTEPGNHEAMGLRLVPLTIGHVRIMDALGCWSLATASDVALAAIICSSPQDRSLAYLGSFLMPLRLWVWRIYLGNWDVAKERSALVRYIESNTELPYCISKGESRPVPVPGHQMVRVRLMLELGYPPDAIDGTPFLQALWDLRTLDVMRGSVEMLDKSEADVMEAESRIDWEKVREAGERILKGSE